MEREARSQRQIDEIKRLERERIQREYEQQQENELARFKNLLQEANFWKQANVIRDYIEAIKIKPLTLDIESERLTEWIAWASIKADWYDPTVKAKDELLDGVDKITLTLKNKHPNYGW